MLKDVFLLPYTNSLSFGILYLKKPRLIQELTRQSKIREQSIHSTATKTIIETSRDYFSISIYSRKHQASFYSVNVLVLHILCSQKFITRTHISTNSPVLSRPRSKSKYVLYTAVSRKVVQQNRTRQCRKVLWVVGVYGI